jgi:hypothetical protein
MTIGRLTLVASTLLLGLALSAESKTLYVAPNGVATAAGTVEAPLSLAAALEQVAKSSEVSEIVLAGGEYFTSGVVARAPQEGGNPLPPLTLRAAAGQSPHLTPARRVQEATPVAGFAHLYQIKVPNLREATAWEKDTNTLYTSLSNKGSVAVVPNSSFYDAPEQTLYLRTSTGQAPSAHEVFVDTGRAPTLFIRRPNTTVEGLSFSGNFAAPSVDIRAKNVTVRRCRFDRCIMAVQPYEGADGAVIEECRGDEVAQPIISYGNDTVIRNNWFEKTRGRFLYTLYPQNDTAYEIYSPGQRGTITGNFAKGYNCGVWIKASGPPYTIRHNTIVDCHYGVMWVTGNSQSDTSYNVITGGSEYISLAHFDSGFTLDHNLFFGTDNLAGWEAREKTIRGANRGRHDVTADPRFVDPARGDYRLLPDSAAAALRDEDGKPTGAFGIATLADADATRPALKLAFGYDSTPFGASGSLEFEGDPWNGTGTSHVRDLRPEGAPPMRLTKTGQLTLLSLATDPIGKITRMRLTLGQNAPQEMDYQYSYSLAMPKADGTYPLKVEVQNDRGLWSEPAEALIRTDKTAPQIAGQPRLTATANGVLVEFNTNEPCTARLRYGTSKDRLTNTMEARGRVARNWDANDGGNWVETWTLPSEAFAIALARPQVKTGETVFFRIEVTDAAGQTTTGPIQSAKLSGPARTLYVAPTGTDMSGNGSTNKPFATLQYAVDRALPGDRVLIKPGTYFGATYIPRGGADENARLVIEAEQPGTVTLDSARRADSVIHLESAPYVTIRGLRILYFKHSGVQSYKSPYTVVDNCTIYDGPGWVKGYGYFAFYSPHCTVTRSLVVGAESGAQFLKSPYAMVTHNTMSQSMYGTAGYAFDLRGIVQKYNSFAFGGNTIVEFAFGTPQDLATVQSDYNNYGTDVIAYGPNERYKTQAPELWAQMEKERFKTDYPPALFRTISKGVVSGAGGPDGKYLTMRNWQRDSGLDQHSIFADPKYVNPLAPIDRWDWRLKPDSPNIRSDVPGGSIGAFGPAKAAAR